MDMLYESELPLFEGEFLLDGFSLAAELASGPQKYVESGTLQAPLSPEGDLKPAQLFHSLTGEQTASVPGDAQHPFHTEWLDTKLDLLEFLDTDGTADVAVEECEDALSVLNRIGQQQQHPVVVEQLSSDNQTLMEALTSLTEALDVPVPEISPVSPLSSRDTEVEIRQPWSPVSVDDIESLLSPSTSTLSTAPPSPHQSEHDDTFNSILYEMMTADDKTESAAGPVRKSKSRKKAPYGSAKKDYDKSLDRKERKKQQNKDAALRYRSKKRSEQDILNDQADELEEKNKVLRDKVDSISREIQYLKDLMSEVHKAKQLKG